MTLREASVKILTDAGCDEKTYRGEKKDVIFADLTAAFDGRTRGLFGWDEEVLAADIYALSTTEPGWEEPIRYDVPGINGSHCGVSDLYPEVEQALSALIAGGHAFETGSISSKKELASWAMRRELRNGPIEVFVDVWMDDAEDLIYDAVGELCAKKEVSGPIEFEEEIEQSILDAFYDGSYATEVREQSAADGKSELSQILPIVSELYTKASEQLEVYFQCMIAIVKDHIEHLSSGEHH